MSASDIENVTPAQLDQRSPVVAAVRESSRSPAQSVMDQTNPMSELSHKRRLSLMGPGGPAVSVLAWKFVMLTRRTMAVPVRWKRRKVPMVGLVLNLPATRINEYGAL